MCGGARAEPRELAAHMASALLPQAGAFLLYLPPLPVRVGFTPGFWKGGCTEPTQLLTVVMPAGGSSELCPYLVVKRLPAGGKQNFLLAQPEDSGGMVT